MALEIPEGPKGLDPNTRAVTEIVIIFILVIIK